MSDTKLWSYHQDANRISLKEGYHRQRYLITQAQKLLKKGVRLFELGFGDGYLLYAMKSEGYQVIGQDLSQANIDDTKKQWNDSSMDLRLGDDSGKLIADNESVDIFIASEVFEHMTDDVLVIATKEMNRILAKDGYIFLTFPYNENLDASMQYCPHCGETFHTWGHKQSWNDEKIRHLFGDFEIITIRRFMSLGSAHYNNLAIRYIAVFLNLLFKISPNAFSFLRSNYLVILGKK